MTDGPEERGSSASIRVVGGSPTDEETAAVAAVFTQLLLEQGASMMPLAEQPAVEAWLRSARGLRKPLPRGATWVHHD